MKNSIKKFVGSLALGAALATSVAVPSFAQDWHRNNQGDRRDDRWNDRNHNRNAIYMRQEMERGYRDGFMRGRMAAQSNRGRNFNSFIRNNSQYYRQGFERGFNEAYNQYSRNNRGRRW